MLLRIFVERQTILPFDFAEQYAIVKRFDSVIRTSSASVNLLYISRTWNIQKIYGCGHAETSVSTERYQPITHAYSIYGYRRKDACPVIRFVSGRCTCPLESFLSAIRKVHARTMNDYRTQHALNWNTNINIWRLYASAHVYTDRKRIGHVGPPNVIVAEWEQVRAVLNHLNSLKLVVASHSSEHKTLIYSRTFKYVLDLSPPRL